MQPGDKGYPVDGNRKDAFRLGCQRPTDLRCLQTNSNAVGRQSGAVFCRFQGAMGKEKERAKILSSALMTAARASGGSGIDDSLVAPRSATMGPLSATDALGV